MEDATARDAEIFAGALRLPPVERAGYLTRACGPDAALLKRVEELLKAQFRMGDFLETPNQESGFSIAATAEEELGRVGRYRLIEKIGEGGCGVVYRAEQDEPVRREVALKIIKPGMDTKEVIARFEAERQALAMMDHPSIAKVLDAGQTESGRPYFVMELVRGIKITDYCDQQALPTTERLKLFMQVCQAIQHAHQKGVIHRDIKPSNILVATSAEGVPQPVVIDFGIAKATVNVRLTDKTLFTAVDMLIGTPTYMSPEQATATGADVDTRSDIYSLGVLLYELLTGATPFDAGELLQLGIDEVRRAIREQEPPHPSARLGKMTGETLAGVARHRKAEPQTLIRSVRGDLDWIVMKALEKDRARRYATANDLAQDVSRFLADETVSARPASMGYRLQKTAQRHKLLFGSAGAIALLLVVSLVLIAASLAQERRARREADMARGQAEADKARAEVEATKSQQVTRFLEDLLQGVGPSAALGRDTTMLREILDKAVVRIGTELSNQPAVMAELQNRIGSVYVQLAALDQAEAMHRAALAGYRKQLGNDKKEVAASLNLLGAVLIKSGKLPEAETTMREALAIYRKIHGDEHVDVAAAMSRLASALVTDGKDAEAEAVTRSALAMRRKLLGEEHLAVANSLTTLGIVLSNQERYAEAEAIQREALAMRRKLLPEGHPDIAFAMANLCWTLSNGDSKETEPLMRESLAMMRKLYGEEHPAVSDGLSLLTGVLRRGKKLDEAEVAIREAIVISSKSLGDDHRSTILQRQTLGQIFAEQGKYADAEAVFRDTLAVRRRTQGSGHLDVGMELTDLGEVLFKQGRLAEAETSYRESVATLRKAMEPSNPVLASSLAGFGEVLHRSGNVSEAETLLREATAIEHGAFEEGNPLRVRSLGRLLAVLEAQGKAMEAEAVRLELESAKR